MFRTTSIYGDGGVGRVVPDALCGRAWCAARTGPGGLGGTAGQGAYRRGCPDGRGRKLLRRGRRRQRGGAEPAAVTDEFEAAPAALVPPDGGHELVEDGEVVQSGGELDEPVRPPPADRLLGQRDGGGALDLPGGRERGGDPVGGRLAGG